MLSKFPLLKSRSYFKLLAWRIGNKPQMAVEAVMSFGGTRLGGSGGFGQSAHFREYLIFLNFFSPGYGLIALLAAILQSESFAPEIKTNIVAFHQHSAFLNSIARKKAVPDLITNVVRCPRQLER
jgi:hypothetical protein